MFPSDTTALDATALSEAIHARQVSCREVMSAQLARIHALNPSFNAIVNLAPDDALLAQADACDAEIAQGRSRGWLHGIPVGIKDTAHAVGFPTTYGVSLLRDAMPAADSIHVRRMKAAGCIVMGKTNMPEFGLGSHSYNSLFGTTLNAWDRTRSAGGSSGGAAVALAQRLMPLGDGSDFMGSLRNPAGWNHCFGLRPSQGRVPTAGRGEVWVSQLGTDGPMARTVRDLARLLQTQAGPDLQAPLALGHEAGGFVPGPGATVKGARIGWLADLGGHLAVEEGILEGCERALKLMQEAGAHVEPLALGFAPDQLWDAWLVWRQALVGPSVAAVLALRGDGRSHLKPEALWEHDQAQGLAVTTFMEAAKVRTAFYLHLLALFERFDALALPVSQVWPFDAAQTWPRKVAGRTMDTYHRWMECTLYATFAGLPAISVPAGFDAAGRLPLGLQIIGRPQGDAALLALAAGYEALVSAMMARCPPAD
jgi:amidase